MKKPIFKKWWFWVIIVVVSIAIIGTVTEETEDSVPNTNGTTTDITETTKDNTSSKKEYQKVDIQSMLDELEENALRAESKYQNAYIEITGKIANFDSDGAYITVEPVNANEWNFDTIMCYIKKSEQKDFIMEKSVGDTVTIKGKIISIGEILGYSMNIDSIS